MFAHSFAIMGGWGEFIGTHFAATQAMRSILALPGGFGYFLTWLLIGWGGGGGGGGFTWVKNDLSLK